MNFTMLHMDSWTWKISIVLALVGMRQFVRLLSPSHDTAGGGFESKASENARWLIETLDSAAIAIGLVLFVIQPFLLQAFFIPSGSMEDTLLISDRLLVSKLVYRLRSPRSGEVVVFRAPDAALGSSNHEETDFIKRCMGTPGDTISINLGKITRNGNPLIEPYTKWSSVALGLKYTYDMKIVGGTVYSREYDGVGMPPGAWQHNNVMVPQDQQAALNAAPPGKVPPGQFLMLGDHRNNSNDSHVWGFTTRDSIVGKAIFVFWPPERLGLVDHLSAHPRLPHPFVSHG